MASAISLNITVKGIVAQADDTASFRMSMRQYPVDLPPSVKKIVGAHHFIADLTLPYGRVLHDYLRA